MPEISRFYGIIIGMYNGDHNPPHFHVRYNDYRAVIWITSAKYLGGYCLQLTFNDGTIKIFDGKDIVLKPLYKSLQSLSAFQQFELDGWTVSWDNGKIDIAPEYLYENAVAA